MLMDAQDFSSTAAVLLFLRPLLTVCLLTSSLMPSWAQNASSQSVKPPMNSFLNLSAVSVPLFLSDFHVDFVSKAQIC